MRAAESASEKQIVELERLLAVRKAHDSLIDFARLLNPHPEHPDDPSYSRFAVKPHHRLIAENLEAIESGRNLRLILSMPPQHGKTEQISRLFPAWYMGRGPWRNVMVGGYSQDFVNVNIGTHIRAYMQMPEFAEVFPECKLKSDSKAKDYMQTTRRGQISMLGREGSGTGKPADLFIVDDPIKDDAEAQSDTVREKVYQWFTKVAYTRIHKHAAIVIVHTRWHEDDLIGRLTDPTHPNHDEQVAAAFKVLNIPAIVTDPALADALKLELALPPDENIREQFGDKPMAALWEERFDLHHLASAKRLNPRGFTALYQGSPSPEDGDYFKRADIQFYDRPSDLPGDLRYYAASDHALSEKTAADPSVLGTIGVDPEDNIWIMPDLIWQRMQTDRTIEEMIGLMKRRKPELWFAEADNIKKSIGPFLRRRMQEERVYTPVVDIPTAKNDKTFRARSIQGRVQQRKVYLPKFAHWCEAAVKEMLKFPNGAHDDFVDFLGLIGQGLDSERGRALEGEKRPAIPQRGTFGWLKWQSKRQERRRTLKMGGW